MTRLDGRGKSLVVRKGEGLRLHLGVERIRLRSRLRNAPASCATRRLSADSSSGLSPSPLRQWLSQNGRAESVLGAFRALRRADIVRLAGELGAAFGKVMHTEKSSLCNRNLSLFSLRADARPSFLVVADCGLPMITSLWPHARAVLSLVE